MVGLEIGMFGAIVLLVLALVALSFLLHFIPLPLWIAAWASGAYVGSSRSSACACAAYRPPR